MSLKASLCSSIHVICILTVLFLCSVGAFKSPPIVYTNAVKDTKFIYSQLPCPSSSWLKTVYSKNDRNRNFAFSRLDLKNQKNGKDYGVFSSKGIREIFERKGNDEKDINKKRSGGNTIKNRTISKQKVTSLAVVGNNDDENDGFIEKWLGEWNNPTFWKGVVVAICLVWSTNFAVVKDIFDDVPDMDPSLYCALRFTIAGIVCLPNALSNLRNSDLFIRSSYIGLSVFMGYIGQTNGMQGGSTADKCAFICSLNVVWVAAVASIRDKQFKVETWVATTLAIVGVGFLELAGTGEVEANDLWLILQPLGFGSGYLFLEDVIKDYPKDAAAITSFKLIAITICSCIWAFVYDGNTWDDVAAVADSGIAVAGILYTGLITTAAAIWVQSLAFKRVSAKDVSMILTTEPIWAALFSSFLIGEVFTPVDGIGAFLILSGCVVNDQDFSKLFPQWFPPKEADVPLMESKKK